MQPTGPIAAAPGAGAPGPRPAGAGTIGARFAAGSTRGFDYLRLSLSLIVLFWHSNGIVAAGHGPRSAALQLFARIAVPMFFALSGFLVSSSLDRTGDAARFLVNRLLRIVPALAVVVAASALILGPLWTTLPLDGYFADPGFAAYFLNLAGRAHYYLPGVAAGGHPIEINRSLWTIPREVQCYLALAALFAAGGFRRTGLLTAALAAVTLLCAWNDRHFVYTAAAPCVPGHLVTVYFLAGVIVYRLRGSLPGGPVVAAALLAAAWAMLADPRLTLLSPLGVAYAAAALGCTAPRRLPIIFYGDYSYGLYLYGMPVQQGLIALFGATPLWLHFPLSVTVTGVVAALSWHWVEKPALALKGRVWRREVAATRLALA